MPPEQASEPREQSPVVTPGRCPSCGEALAEATRFCEACGFELDGASTAVSTPEPEEDPLGRLGRFWPVIALAWVILAVLAWAWVYGRAILLG